jgi:subtilisin family serine protease
MGLAPVDSPAHTAGLSVAQARDDRAGAVQNGLFTDRVIIRCTPATSIEALAASAKDGPSSFGTLAARWNVRFVIPTFFPAPKDEASARRLGMDRFATLVVPDGTDVRAMAGDFAKLTDLIEMAEVDLNGRAHSDPNDALFSQQWALNNVGQTVNGQPGVAGADIHAEAAWAISHSFTPIVVAILDTGVSQSHPDLAGVQVPGHNTVQPSTPDAYDDTANGLSTGALSVSHGTYCAGIAGAAFNNGIGIAGVSPNVRIMPVKVLANIALGSQTSCANGLVWASDNGARVASMSLGWGGSTSALSTAISYASAHNVLMCASVGNAPGTPISFPASSPSDSIIAVGGTANTDQSFVGETTGSQMGLVAPAADVLCTTDEATTIDGYSLQSGTSMACPIIAGVAAMIMGEEPSLTALQVRDILESTADDLGDPGRDPIFGFGRVNAAAAMQAAHRLVCPIDIDGNGHVDIYDIFAYVGYFFQANPLADFDHSGSATVDDLFLFLSAYIAGGC